MYRSWTGWTLGVGTGTSVGHGIRTDCGCVYCAGTEPNEEGCCPSETTPGTSSHVSVVVLRRTSVARTAPPSLRTALGRRDGSPPDRREVVVVVSPTVAEDRVPEAPLRPDDVAVVGEVVGARDDPPRRPVKGDAVTGGPVGQTVDVFHLRRRRWRPGVTPRDPLCRSVGLPLRLGPSIRSRVDAGWVGGWSPGTGVELRGSGGEGPRVPTSTRVPGRG